MAEIKEYHYSYGCFTGIVKAKDLDDAKAKVRERLGMNDLSKVTIYENDD